MRPPGSMVKAAEAILQDNDAEAIEKVHIENAFQKLIDETNALTEDMPKGSEASARMHMAWLSLQDAREAWESNTEGED